MQLFTLTTLGLMALAPAPAPVTLPKVVRPSGGQPNQSEVVFRQGSLVVTMQRVQYVTEERMVSRVGPDGKERPERITVTVPVYAAIQNVVDSTTATMYRSNGEVIDKKEYAKLLEKTRMVFVSSDGKKVDPFYLQFMADDALVLVLPPARAEAVPMTLPVVPEKQP